MPHKKTNKITPSKTQQKCNLNYQFLIVSDIYHRIIYSCPLFTLSYCRFNSSNIYHLFT